MSSRYPKRKRPATDYAAMLGKKPRKNTPPPADEPQPATDYTAMLGTKPRQNTPPPAEELQPAVESDPDYNEPEPRAFRDRLKSYTPSSIDSYIPPPDYPPGSPVSHVSSFTGSEREREQNFLKEYYARAEAELAEKQKRGEEYGESEPDDEEEEDSHEDYYVESVTDEDEPSATAHTTQAGSGPRSLGKYSVRDVIEGMAIVFNFVMDVKPDAGINLDQPQTIKYKLNYYDKVWSNKGINWRRRIRRARQRGEETAERFYDMRMSDFMALAYDVISFGRELHGRGIPLLD
ncbi:hypothetical protein F5Y06DRAFT_213834 [Hypoxylon sp. FL0890]|nr:hypothetical protein F5Y06DRAFT_213834 [Hypoxylon sp. FL0890]